MSPHWRLALRYAAWVAAGVAVGAVAIWSVYGGANAGSFAYGAVVGIVSSLSMAITVSLITGRSVVGMMLGAFSFIARYAFAAGALGLPAYLGLWPAVAMCGGFAAVYLVENVALLPLAASSLGKMKIEIDADTGDSGEKVERRVEI